MESPKQSPIKTPNRVFKNKNKNDIIILDDAQDKDDDIALASEREMLEEMSKSKALQAPKKKKLVFPKNINEYRHIIDTFHVLDSELLWALELRTYKDKVDYKGLKNTHIKQPTFYDTDLDKYKNKTQTEMNAKKKDIFTRKGNSTNYNHLLNHRIGASPNNGQACFETTLRNFKADPGFKESETKWRPVSNRLKSTLFSEYLPPMRYDSKQNLKKIKDLTTRPYNSVYQVVLAFNNRTNK